MLNDINPSRKVIKMSTTTSNGPYMFVCKTVRVSRVGAQFCTCILLDFSLTVKAAALISISGRGSAISSAKQGNSGFIYDLVNS